MNTTFFIPAQRHGFWLLWVHWITSRYMPAVMDDFGYVVQINTVRALHSLDLPL